MTVHALPQRTANLSDEQIGEIIRLDIRGMSHLKISHHVGVTRTSVERAVERSKSMLKITQSMQGERDHALETYREVQRAAWETFEQITNPNKRAAILTEIRQSQRSIDALLDLPLKKTDVDSQSRDIVAFVASFVQDEVPELAPKLLAALREVQREN